jgi:hypothetical protein
MLVLWANLHGTVTLGVALVVLRAGTLAWDRRAQLRRSARAWRRPLALAAGAVIAPLLTPYGLQIIDYYRATMLGSALKHTVSEWQPITFSPGTAAVFFLAAGIAIWSFGRDARRTTTWERIALLLLMAGAIDVIRNSLFFGLLGLIVVPVSLSGVAAARTPRADRLRGSVNLALSAAALIAVLVAGVSTLVHSPDRLEFHSQRPGVLSAVSRITRADPAIRVLAEDRFTDWLMWRDPALEGRLANDVRYELLTESQLDALNRVFGVIGPDWKNAARGYRLLVLNRRFVPAAVTAFTAEPGSRVAYDDGERVVILRSVKAAR